MTGLRALDLYCCAGGAARGLQRASFHVTGWDLVYQPRYAGDSFSTGDALSLPIEYLRTFDFIWASPPCQAHTSMKSMHNAKDHVDLIAPTRVMLMTAGVPFVIENVIGAPLIDPFTLCGTMFGLKTACGAELRRHRRFEANFPIMTPDCRHGTGGVIGIYGGHYRDRQRPAGRNKGDHGFTADDGRTAMGIDWPMTGDELSQAIPPAFSEFIAREFLRQRRQGPAKAPEWLQTAKSGLAATTPPEATQETGK